MQAEAVIEPGRVWLAREAESMERFIEPLAAAIARKHASCPVSSVRSRRQPHDKKRGRGLAECRDGTTPVFFRPVPAHFLQRYPLPPFDQPRTLATLYDGFL